MKAFKKIMMVGMAAGAIAVAMSATAFADVAAVANVASQTANGVVSVTAGDILSTEGQVTVVLLEATKDAEGQYVDNKTTVLSTDILYIDQDTIANGVLKDMGVKLAEGETKLADGDYVLRVGGDNLSSMERIFFTVASGTLIQLGDCDGTPGVSSGDATAVLEEIAGKRSFVNQYLFAADCDGTPGVSSGDATAILEEIAGKRTLDKVLYTGTLSVEE